MHDDTHSFSDLNTDAIRAILHTFLHELPAPRAIIFCLRCGSTQIDQQAIAQLRCIACGNTCLWNGFHFSIARPASAPHDVRDALRLARNADYFDDWHRAMETALSSFMQALIHESNTHRRARSVEERAAQLETTWEATKACIDELMARRA